MTASVCARRRARVSPKFRRVCSVSKMEGTHTTRFGASHPNFVTRQILSCVSRSDASTLILSFSLSLSFSLPPPLPPSNAQPQPVPPHSSSSLARSPSLEDSQIEALMQLLLLSYSPSAAAADEAAGDAGEGGEDRGDDGDDVALDIEFVCIEFLEARLGLPLCPNVSMCHLLLVCVCMCKRTRCPCARTRVCDVYTIPCTCMQAYAWVYSDEFIHTFMHTSVYMKTFMHISGYIHPYIHTFTVLFTRTTYIFTCDKQKLSHTRARAHTRAHTHTRARARALSLSLARALSRALSRSLSLSLSFFLSLSLSHSLSFSLSLVSHTPHDTCTHTPGDLWQTPAPSSNPPTPCAADVTAGGRGGDLFGAGVGKEGEGGGGSVSEVDPSEWLAALAMCLQTALTSADVGRCVFAPVASKGY